MRRTYDSTSGTSGNTLSMAGFGGDVWMTDHDACVRLGQSVMEMISERDNLQRSGSSCSKMNASIRSSIRRYQQDVQLLDQNLKKSASSFHLTQREADRRRALVDTLIAKEKIINDSFKKDITYAAPERASLLPSTSGFGQEWGGVNEETRTMGISELQQEQQRILEVQDEGLDQLSAIITKQKRMGQVIGQEVDEHNEIIDDITNHVGKTDQRLIKETKHIRKVSEKAKDCTFIVIIVVLLVAIVIIAAIPYNKKP